MKKTIYIVIILVMLSFGVRLAVVLNTYVISSDGPFYIKVSQYFAQGDYKSALVKQTFHPLYPFLIAVAYKIIGTWEWAGLLVSIFFASVGVIPLYFIGRRYFPSRIVITSCIFYAFHPFAAQLSASILTTGVFIGIFLFALWVTIIALETGRYKYFLLSGLLSFIMYLVRPDGMVFLLLSLIGIWINRNKLTGASRFLCTLFLVIPWVLLMPPYIGAIKAISGEMNITGKASIKQMIGLESKNPDSMDASDTSEGILKLGAKNIMGQYFNGLYLMLVDFIRGANVLLFILFLIGIISYFKHEDHGLDKSFFVWLVFAAFVIILVRYGVIYERMSKRYTVPLFMLVILWAGNGLYVLSEWMSRRLKHHGRFYYFACIFTVIILSFFTFQPVGKSKIIEKTTGELLNKYHSEYGIKDKIPNIITTSSRIAYYGKGNAIMPEELGKDYSKLADIILGRKIDYLVLDGRIVREMPFLENEILRHINNRLLAELILTNFEVAKGEGDGFYKTYRFLPISIK
jgi:hypothetical protein